MLEHGSDLTLNGGQFVRETRDEHDACQHARNDVGLLHECVALVLKLAAHMEEGVTLIETLIPFMGALGVETSSPTGARWQVEPESGGNGVGLRPLEQGFGEVMRLTRIDDADREALANQE